MEVMGKILTFREYIVLALSIGLKYGGRLSKEINILSLAFLCDTSKTDPVLSILHIDHQERLQLLSRDVSIDRDKTNAVVDISLSVVPSVLLPSTTLPTKLFAFPFDDVCVPTLIPIPPSSGSPGGVAVVGGKKIMMYEIAPLEKQKKLKGKQSRLEGRKKADDKTEAMKAREKEKEREGRQRRANMTVEWPWSDLSAWCRVEESLKFLLCDTYGRLAMLSFEATETHGIVLMALGEVHVCFILV
jgi:DNA damage-binding protein 1